MRGGVIESGEDLGLTNKQTASVTEYRSYGLNITGRLYPRIGPVAVMHGRDQGRLSDKETEQTIKGST